MPNDMLCEKYNADGPQSSSADSREFDKLVKATPPPPRFRKKTRSGGRPASSGEQ
ncbi:MAG: hypothetical protein ACREQ5_03335 [Candidatus Dormibacteria bacterium]